MLGKNTVIAKENDLQPGIPKATKGNKINKTFKLKPSWSYWEGNEW